MKITKRKDEVYEINFFDKTAGLLLGIVLEEDYGIVVWVTDVLKEANSFRLPDEVFEMFKDEYKVKRPEIILPKLEDIEPLPWE